MVRLTTALSLACCVLRVSTSQAQASREVSQRDLHVTAGITLSDRIDRVVSPSRFSGAGLDAAVGYVGVGRTMTFIVSARGGARTLASSGAQQSDERVTEGDVHLIALTALAPHALGTSVAFGVDMQTTAALIAHRYMDPTARTMSYVFGSMMVGPAVLIERRVGDGSATAQLSVPVAGIVAQPYSAVWSERSPLALRLATLNSLQSASAVATYQSAARHGVSMLYEYRVGVMRYEHVLPVRGLSQSVSAGIARRL
jgi:hypothetical protein